MNDHGKRFLTGRRGLLQGLGLGAVLLAPFARARLSFAAPAATANILIWFTPNGQGRAAFGAEGARTTFTLKPSLSPLAPYKDKIVVIKGLCNKGQSARSTHSDAMKLLICRYGDGERYKGNGPSFDWVMAQAIKQASIFTHAMPDVKGAGTMNGLSWSAAGSQRSLTSNPQTLFSDLFSGLSPSRSPDDAASRDQLALLAKQNKSLLDFLLDDLARFKGRLSRADRARLDLHVESLRELERQVTAEPASRPASQGCAVDGTRAPLDASAGDSADTLRRNGLGKVDIIANAFACGVRRVAVLVWQNASAGINPVGGGGSHHDITHEGPTSTRQRIDAWYAERFADTLAALESRGQLDNTMVLWVSDTSEEHNQNNNVNVLAGGGALGIRTGQFIDLPFTGDEDGDAATAHVSGNASFADVLVSMQKAFGVASDHFGDEKHSNGGIPGLFVGA